MNVDLREIEESKRQMRRRLAALPFAEKLRMLEELRERSLALGANPLRQGPIATKRDCGNSVSSLAASPLRKSIEQLLFKH
jgi:hypothetical protein